jgi:hypothetical protein
MAEGSRKGGERTEEPSQRRLQEARERGQVPRSRELTNFATMIGGSATLVAIGGSLTAHLSQVMRRGMSIDAQALRDPHSMIERLERGMHLRADRAAAGVRRLDRAGVAGLGGSRRLEFQRPGAGAGFHALEPAGRIEAALRPAWRIRVGQGASQTAGGGRGVRGNRLLAVRRCAGAGTHDAARRRRARRGPLELGVRLAVRIARIGGRRRRAAAAVSVQTLAAHDPPGIARRVQGTRRPPRDQAAHPPDAANAGAPPHDAQGADRGRGDRQPDPLRGGLEIRPKKMRAPRVLAKGADWSPPTSAASPRSIACRCSSRRNWRARCTARPTSTRRFRRACTWRWRRCCRTSSGCAP